jgi:3-isopropylmalate/(R)-2-methylmalate dehydratase small subunit
MNTTIKGRVFVLGDDIDTDQIIPAEHLVYSLEKPEERKFYGRYCLSGVPDKQSGLPLGGIPFSPSESFESEYTIVVAGKNFGCGSSREHAPFAMQVAGCRAVIASTYARIFYRNAVDGGFLVPYESFDDISSEFKTNEEVEIDVELNVVHNLSTGKSFPLQPLGDVADIVQAGGIFEFARKKGMIA